MQYVRVSEILSRLQDFGNVPPAILQNKAEIGTDVHTLINCHANSEFIPVEVEKRRLAYFHSYHLWAEEFKPIYKITEQRFNSDILMVTGQMDAIVTYHGHDDELYLLDFKTSNKESFTRDGVSAWELQAHFYAQILIENDIQISEKMYWIRLRAEKVQNEITGEWEYIGLRPHVHTYKFDQVVLDRCFEEAHRYWEERSNAVCVD